MLLHLPLHTSELEARWAQIAELKRLGKGEERSEPRDVTSDANRLASRDGANGGVGISARRGKVGLSSLDLGYTGTEERVVILGERDSLLQGNPNGIGAEWANEKGQEGNRREQAARLLHINNHTSINVYQ
jgi:hypothetical protein